MSTPDYSRRIFLRALGLGAAGLAVGGAAAWAESALSDQTQLQAAAAAWQNQALAAETQQATLKTSLAGVQNQLSTLHTQLGAATSQNAQLAEALTNTQQTVTTLHAQLAETQQQLAAAQARLSQHQELLGLWDQLENQGLDTLAATGLQSAAAGLAAALGSVPLVRAGVAAAQDLLQNFENVLPDFQAGLAWLSDQVLELKLSLFALEKAAQPLAVSAAAGVVGAFSGIVKLALDYLPFEIGDRLRAAFRATEGVVTRSQDLAGASDDKVFNKLSRYVSGGPRSWQTQLAPPLRQQTLRPAADLATAVEGAQRTFDATLNAPVQAALERRAALRAQIAAYREQHGL